MNKMQSATVGIDFIGVSTPFYCHDGKGNFLFAQRSERCRDEHGAWDPGSGKLEFGSSIEANVLREVQEEYGCRGTIQEFLPAHSIVRKHEGKTTHWVAVPAFVLVKRAEVRFCEPEKFTQLGWFRLDSLPKPLHTGFQQTLAKFPEYFVRYGSTTPLAGSP